MTGRQRDAVARKEQTAATMESEKQGNATAPGQVTAAAPETDREIASERNFDLAPTRKCQDNIHATRMLANGAEDTTTETSAACVHRDSGFAEAIRLTPAHGNERQAGAKVPPSGSGQGSSLTQRMRSAANHKLPGQFLFENFVSDAEEQELVRYLDACEPAWQLSSFNGPHRGKAWGVRMDLQRRTVVEPKFPMPPLLVALGSRMRELHPLASFHPTEANANEYRPQQGMYLGPHVDDRQLSTGAIVTLSLVSAATMSFQRDKQPGSPTIRILLPPRSLQVLTKESRYSYTHAIHPSDFYGSRRLSITFRQSPLRR